MSVKWVPLGEILDLRRSRIEVDPQASYRQIGVRGFGRGLIDYPVVAGSELSKLDYFELEADRLVLSSIKAWEGAVALTSPEETGRVASNRFLTYAGGPKVELRYVLHWLCSEAGVAALGQVSPGSADRNRTLSRTGFLKIDLPLPPLSEQRRVADHLDGVERAAVPPDLRELGALRDRLVERATESTVTLPAGDVLELQRRAVDVEVSDIYREVGVRSYGNGLFIKEPLTGADLGQKRVFWIRADDLVVSNVFAWEGAVALATQEHDGLIGSHRFMTWVAKGTDLKPAFAREYFRSSIGVSVLAAASPGSAGRNRTLGVRAFEQLSIPLPPTSVQAHVASIGAQLDLMRAQSLSRNKLVKALLPAARNEIFNAMR